MTDHPGSDRRIEIVPSVLPADFSRLGRGGGGARGGRRRPHPVGRDGRPLRANLTFGPDVIAACRAHAAVPFEAHLMVEEPDELARALRRGRLRAAHRPRRGVPPPAPHARPHPRARRPRRRWPSTPPRPRSAVEHVLDLVDLVLVMTVNPGFGGQAYIATMEPKVAEVRRLVARGRPRRRHRGRRRHRPVDDPGRGGGRRQRARGRLGAVPRPRGPRPRGHRAAGARRGHPPLNRRRRATARRGAWSPRSSWSLALASALHATTSGSAEELCARRRRGRRRPPAFQGFDPTDPEAALDQLRAARVDARRPARRRARGGPRRPRRWRSTTCRRSSTRSRSVEPGDATESALQIQAVTDAHPDVDEAAANLAAFADEEC